MAHFLSLCQRGRQLRRSCKSDYAGESPVAGSIFLPKGGLSSKVERLFYMQDTVERYHQPLLFILPDSFNSRTPDRHSGDVGAVSAFGTIFEIGTCRA